MCGTTDAIEMELPRALESPAYARDLVEEHLCRDHGRAALAAAQLLATELVTCAVLYGEAPIDLRLECQVTRLRISVTHRVEGRDPAELPVDEDGGLRSALLEKLSRSWGVDRADGRRTLWSSLPTGALPPGPGRRGREGPVVSLEGPPDGARVQGVGHDW